MASSEGAREIEAAQKRLAAAKARATADATALDSARGVEASVKKMATLAEKKVSAAERALAAAREMAELSEKTDEAAADTREGIEARTKESKKEVKCAKKMLKDAEDRWEVVAVHDSDSESEASEEGSSRKKQKKSDGANKTLRVEDEEIVDEDDFNVEESDDEDPEEIVEGAGTAEANGTYARDGTENGRPKYVKGSELYGQMLRFTAGGVWSIVVRSANGYPNHIYYAATQLNLPPKTGWNRYIGGRAPAPELKW